MTLACEADDGPKRSLRVTLRVETSTTRGAGIVRGGAG